MANRTLLGRDEDSLLVWSTSLSIYRINRFSTKNKCCDAFDPIEALLSRNMNHIVEMIFAYVGLKYVTRSCSAVRHLWYDFLWHQDLIKRWAELIIIGENQLIELAHFQGWIPHLFIPSEKVTNSLMYGRICWKIRQLREAWQIKSPTRNRLACDSFVLSIRLFHQRLYCGLNNGCITVWDNVNQEQKNWSQLTEKEIHNKGVKCIDLNELFLVTGSYDCTAKVWIRDKVCLLHVITSHTDSVWDIKMQGNVFVTGSLDGTVALFEIGADPSAVEGFGVTIRFIIQAHEELVAAVDFGQNFLLAGFEDSNIGVWKLKSKNQVENGLYRLLRGHAGGITGLKMNRHEMVASSSYDGSVRLWCIEGGVCLACLDQPSDFVRCIAFRGKNVVCGDFGGHIHIWNLTHADGRKEKPLAINHYRRLENVHKSHVVCLQIDACRIVSGSRDKTALVIDFWNKL